MGFPLQHSRLCVDWCRLEIPDQIAPDTPRAYALGVRSGRLRVATFLVEPSTVHDRLPVVIFNRGGNQLFGSVTARQIVDKLFPLARAGYIVVASQYRGGAGSEGNDEFGGSDLNDVLILPELLRSHPNADLGRIGMIGESRGGMMTYLALRKADWVRAAVTIGGLADLERACQLRPEMAEVFRERFGGDSESMANRSILRWPERISKSTPLLLLHGSADWRVSPFDTLQLSQAFIRERVPHRAVILEGADHSLSEHRVEAQAMMLDWLQKYVVEGRTWPSLEPHGR